MLNEPLFQNLSMMIPGIVIVNYACTIREEKKRGQSVRTGCQLSLLYYQLKHINALTYLLSEIQVGTVLGQSEIIVAV